MTLGSIFSLPLPDYENLSLPAENNLILLGVTRPVIGSLGGALPLVLSVLPVSPSLPSPRSFPWE